MRFQSRWLRVAMCFHLSSLEFDQQLREDDPDLFLEEAGAEHLKTPLYASSISIQHSESLTNLPSVVTQHGPHVQQAMRFRSDILCRWLHTCRIIDVPPDSSRCLELD